MKRIFTAFIIAGAVLASPLAAQEIEFSIDDDTTIGIDLSEIPNSNEDEISTDEEPFVLTENVRLKLNLGDSLFYNGISYGNSTDISFDVMFLNNTLGLGVGCSAKECINSAGDFALRFAPYASFNFFGAKVYGGIVPYGFESGEFEFSPYGGFNYNWDICADSDSDIYGNWAVYAGAEWYVNAGKGDTIGDGFAALFDVLIPKIYVGAEYRVNFVF